MRKTLLLIVVIGVLAVAATGIAYAAVPEAPYDTNAECLECHDVALDGAAISKVDFTNTVDLARCWACHYQANHLKPSYLDCMSCHPNFPTSAGQYYADTNTPYGWFSSSSSLYTDATTLHRIHVNGDWAVNYFPSCAGACHGKASCSACHGPDSAVAHGQHTAGAYPAVTYAQSTGSSYAARATTCVNPACHSLADASSGTFVPTCSSCHAEKADAHGYETVDHVADDGMAEGIACSACHSLDLATEHDKATSSSAGTGCATCHPTPRDTIGTWDQSCATGGCHTATSSAPMHAATDTAHAVVSAGEVCLGCHDGTDLGSIHTGAISDTGETSCLVCHTATGAPASNDCTVCHFTFEEHYGDERHESSWTLDGCVAGGCHTTRDLMGEHSAWRPDFACSTCHDNASDPRYATAIEAGDTACGACHDVTEGDSHRAVHWAEPPLVDGTGLPGYGYYDGSVSVVRTTDCAMCHASNLVDEHMGVSNSFVTRLPRYDASGQPLDCATCHGSTDLTVAAAIASGVTACETCHPVHGPIGAVHGSDFAGDPTQCTACHSSRLDVEHEGVAAVMPSGTTLNGCAVCHSYTEGAFGAAVQAAIDITNDTSCTACHGTYHDGAGTSHTATAATSLGCAACHGDPAATSLDVTVLHADVSDPGPCTVCHDNEPRVSDLGTKTAECASCHAAEGADYHRAMTTAHTFSAMDASCVGAGCHAADTLPEAHEPYLTRYPQYADTCALCHQNEDADRIDWASASADCATCHEVHGDIATIHTAAASQECVDCHETGDVRQLHGTSPEASCGYCHVAGRSLPASADCVNCHQDHTPVDPSHYPAAAHDAASESGCDGCHYKDMKAEHFKPTVAVTCVTCHEVSVDTFAAPWDQTCTACHPTKHGEKSTKHVSSSTGCGGTGCHDIANVESIHSPLPGSGCSACHVGPDQPATTTECAVCHESATPGHHEEHNAAGANPNGCSGCHFMYLDDEHIKLGYTCDVCHASTDTAVQGAITSGDLACLTCHPDSPHNQRQKWEFNPNRQSVHRTSAELPGMRSSFVVDGATYTWTLPSASTFLKSGWSTDSMMSCDSCHTYSGAEGPHGATMKINIDPAYPNPFKVTTGSQSFTAQLSPNSPTGMSMTEKGSSPAGIICEKCHDLRGSSWSNVVHKEHDDRGIEGGYCNQCHVGIPHGWGRPRLIGYTSDPSAYATWAGTGRDGGGVTRISLKSYSPSNWNKSDCGAGCSSGRHPLSGSSWPFVDGGTTPPPSPTTGVVTGRVSDASTTVGVAGATVSVGGTAVTTSADGTYSVVDLPEGSYSVSVSATGYTTWTGSVSVSAGSTTTKDVALTPVTTPQPGGNLALGKRFSATDTEGWSYSPDRAGDGDLDTYWWSDNNGNDDDRERLWVDLESTYQVSKVEIAWYGSLWARDFRVQVSRDGRDWSEVYRTERGEQGTSIVSFSARDARYVRVECRRTGTGRDNGYGIAELRVFE